mgnify:CR=1 FL=1
MLQQFAAQLGDPGEVVTAKVDGAGESAAAEVDDDRRWVAVWLQSVVDGRRRFLGRLLSPGGLLWWLPEQGEIGAMLRSGNLTGALTTYVASLKLDGITLIWVLFVFYVILGTFFETLPMMVGTLPLVFPLIRAAGIDPSITFLNHAGRPTPAIDRGEVIGELV